MTWEVSYDRYNKITVIWNYKENGQEPPCSHASPPFSLMIEGQPIFFSMSTCYEGNQLNLKLQQGTTRSARAIVTISIERDSKMKTLRSRLAEHWATVMMFENLIEWLSKPIYANLTITCSVTWLGLNKEDNYSCDSSVKQKTFPLYKIRTHFNQDLIPNVKIIIGNEELSAHKSLLALHSPVLLAMFEPPTESRRKRIIIEDIEFNTMKILLKIISTGETEDLDDFNVALKVLEAAEKYQMLMIKEVCEWKLMLQIDNHGPISLLKKADQFNAESLLETCVEYIIAKKIQQITEELEDICLDKPNVAAAVLKTQMSKLSLIPE